MKNLSNFEAYILASRIIDERRSEQVEKDEFLFKKSCILLPGAIPCQTIDRSLQYFFSKNGFTLEILSVQKTQRFQNRA